MRMISQHNSLALKGFILNKMEFPQKEKNDKLTSGEEDIDIFWNFDYLLHPTHKTKSSPWGIFQHFKFFFCW